MTFRAESRASLRDVLRLIDVEGPLRSGRRGKEYTEPYAMAHLLSSLAEDDGLLKFPLELIHRKPPHDKPDFVLSMGGKEIGVEHTDARPESETRKDVIRNREGIGPSVPFLTPVNLLKPGERRPTKALRKEIQANEPKAGWGSQVSIDREWARVILTFIGGKEGKLQAPGFSRYDEDWLLIRDAWPFPSVNRENATKCLLSRILGRRSRLQFHRVFVISSENKGPVCEISTSGFCLHRRNDLWVKRTSK